MLPPLKKKGGSSIVNGFLFSGSDILTLNNLTRSFLPLSSSTITDSLFGKKFTKRVASAVFVRANGSDLS